jgi:WD40 repeat protein
MKTKKLIFILLCFVGIISITQADELPDTVWTKFTYPNAVNAVKFTPDGKYLVTGGDVRIPKLWDSETGELVKEFQMHSSGISDIDISDKFIAIACPGIEGIKIYDVENFNFIKALFGSSDLKFSFDGKYLVAGNSEGGAGITIYETTNWNIIQAMNYDLSIHDLCISPDNKFIARAGYWIDPNDKLKYEILIFDFNNLDNVFSIPNKDNLYCRKLAFSPDGKYLAAAISDSPNKVWNTSDWKLEKELGEGTDSRAIIYSNDSKFIVTSYLIPKPEMCRLFIIEDATGVVKYSYIINYFSKQLGRENGLLAYSIDINKSSEKIAVGTGAGFCMLNAKWTPTSVNDNPIQITEPIIFPNPTNQNANIRFNLLKSSQINISIFDINSKMISSIYDGFLEQGLQTFSWNVSGVLSGTYFAQITANGNKSSIKIVVEK